MVVGSTLFTMIHAYSHHHDFSGKGNVGLLHPSTVGGTNGLGCSPSNAIHELGLQRRETVGSIFYNSMTIANRFLLREDLFLYYL